MSSSETKMSEASKLLDAHFALYQKDSMSVEEFNKWNAAFIVGFYDYQTAKSGFILGKKGLAAAKALVKK